MGNKKKLPEELEEIIVDPTAAPETTEAPEAPEAPAAPETTEAPEAPAAPETTEAPDVQAAPETTETPDVQAAPETTETPDVPESENESENESEDEVGAVAPAIVTGCSRLNVRKEPSKTADVECIIANGTNVQVDIENSTEDFYKIRTSVKDVLVEGYCVKQFIEIK